MKNILWGILVFPIIEDFDDHVLTRLLQEASFKAGRIRKGVKGDDHYLFGLLASILLRLQLGDGVEELEEAAIQLVEQEAETRSEHGIGFLLADHGRATRRHWRKFVLQSIPEGLEDSMLSLIRENLLNDGPPLGCN